MCYVCAIFSTWYAVHLDKKKKKREKITKKGEYIKLQYLNSTHHGGVEFHVPFTSLLVLLRSGGTSLTIFISGFELSVCVCVCVRTGGGDYSSLSFIYRSPREEEDNVAL